MEKMPRSPRMEGVYEQFERAKLFLAEARKAPDRLDRFRRLVASIYFSRAIVELMLEAADQQEIKKTREELEEILVEKLPRYMLIEKLRIHDFHRFGLLEHSGVFLGGPFTLTASQGGVSLQITSEGPKVTTSGNSQVKWRRALLMAGDKAFDDETNEYISIESVVAEYLDAIPKAIEEFQNLRTGGT